MGLVTKRDTASDFISDERAFLRRVLIIILLAALAVATWVLADILLLVFGSILVAVILTAIAEPIFRYTRIPAIAALGVAVVLLLGSLALIAAAFGPEMAVQMRELFARLSLTVAAVTEDLRLGSFMDLMRSAGSASSLGNMLSRALEWSSSLVGALAAAALVLAGGIYLAADPKLYRDGFIKLFAPAVHANIAATLDDCAHALRLWLGGQLRAMVFVGALTGVGLSLVGVPNALALGLIVGLADFVPIIGPIFAAIPVLLSAGTLGWDSALWALGVIIVVQQIESNVVVPLITGRIVAMAPAVGLFAVVAMGVLFGPLGILFGFPLALVIDVAIRRLYVLDGLGEAVEILGEPAQQSQLKAQD